MVRYGIASLFEDYPDSYEFTEANTPMHLTHIDVLEINLEPEEFIRNLRNYLKQQSQFTIIPTKDTFYGPDKDIPVTEIELSSALKKFHSELIAFLELEDATFVNPHFIKENYAPHISIYGSRRVEIGKPITINSVSIGHKRTDIDNPPNRIITTIPLT